MPDMSIVKATEERAKYCQQMSAGYARDAVQRLEVGDLRGAADRQADARIYHLAAAERVERLIGVT